MTANPGVSYGGAACGHEVQNLHFHHRHQTTDVLGSVDVGDSEIQKTDCEVNGEAEIGVRRKGRGLIV